MGVKLAAWWMVEHLGWGFRHGFLLMDAAGTLTALYVLHGLLERRTAVQAAPIELRWFASAGFLALVCFYLMWVGEFFRPETLPSAGLVAVILWLWSSWHLARSKGRRAGVTLGLFAASAVLAWIRADLALLLNLGIFLVCVLRPNERTVGHRTWKVVTSGGCAALAAAIQLYMMRVRYPHASYGPVPILMAHYALRRPLTYPPFLCFMLPVMWTFWRFWREPIVAHREEVDSGLMVGSALYLLLWTLLGKLNEVRIFIPFAMAMIPLTVELALRRIARERAVAGAEIVPFDGHAGRG